MLKETVTRTNIISPFRDASFSSTSSSSLSSNALATSTTVLERWKIYPWHGSSTEEVARTRVRLTDGKREHGRPTYDEIDKTRYVFRRFAPRGRGGGRERNRMEKRRERDDNAVTLCAYGGAGSRRRRCRRRTDSNPYEKNDVGVSL